MVFWSRTGAALCAALDRKSTRLNSSHSQISYAVFCLKKKKKAEDDVAILHECHAHVVLEVGIERDARLAVLPLVQVLDPQLFPVRRVSPTGGWHFALS